MASISNQFLTACRGERIQNDLCCTSAPCLSRTVSEAEILSRWREESSSDTLPEIRRAWRN